jgi:hypothetical protein
VRCFLFFFLVFPCFVSTKIQPTPKVQMDILSGVGMCSDNTVALTGLDETGLILTETRDVSEQKFMRCVLEQKSGQSHGYWRQLFGYRERRFPVVKFSPGESTQMRGGFDVAPNLSLEQKWMIQSRVFPFGPTKKHVMFGEWLTSVEQLCDRVACFATFRTDKRGRVIGAEFWSEATGVVVIEMQNERSIVYRISNMSRNYNVCFLNGKGLKYKLPARHSGGGCRFVELPNSFLHNALEYTGKNSVVDFLAWCKTEQVGVSYVLTCAMCRSFQPTLSRSWVVACLIRVWAFKHGFVDVGQASFDVLCKTDVVPPVKGGYILKPEAGSNFENCKVYDFASYYPSIIAERNICYSTFGFGGDSWLPADVVGNGQGFVSEASSHRGVMPALVIRLMNLKSRFGFAFFKRVLSSLYGTIGSNNVLPQFLVGMWSVASEGRRLIKQCKGIAEQNGLQCICIQTDSLFLVKTDPAGTWESVTEFVRQESGSVLVLRLEKWFRSVFFGGSFYIAIDNDGRMTTSGLFARSDASAWCREAVQSFAVCSISGGSALEAEGVVEAYKKQLFGMSPEDTRLVVQKKNQGRVCSLVPKTSAGCIDTEFYMGCFHRYALKLREALPSIPTDIIKKHSQCET